MNKAITTAAPRPLTARPKPIDGDWPQWIAENRLRDCTPESMLATMVASGLDRDACATAIAQVEHDPAYLAARKHQQLQRKLESVLSRSAARLPSTNSSRATCAVVARWC
jgi:hypothetical protein